MAPRMVDLASCYFCGSVEGLKEYPVIPQDLYPPDEAQRTIVVCPSCREKLGAVLEPIFEYLDSPASTRSKEGRTSTQSRAAPETTPAPEQSPTTAETTSPPPAETGQSTANPTPQRESGVSTNGADEQPEGEIPQMLEDGHETNDRRYTDSRGAGYRWEPGEEKESSNGLSDGAKQVARLLQNRDFPVDREAIEDLANSAYGLSRETSVEALDALIDRGYITESEGVLHKS